MDTRYEDDRPHRRDVTGVESGAFGGALLGLMLGLVVPGLVVLVLAGGAVGATIGRAVTKRVNLEEWDSAIVRPFVGVQAPDSDQA